MFDLTEKICLITGGSGSLGSAIAQAYLAQGAMVYSASRTEGVGAMLPFHECLRHYRVDVGDPQAASDMVADIVREHGRLDILVTAAGVQHRASALAISADDWNRVIQTNLNGAFYCAQAAGRHMVSRGGGRVIMLSSLTAEIGIPNISAYAASRGGIRQLCKTLAVEWAPNNVTVNCIGPGRIATSMTADLMAQPDKYQSTLEVIPMGRWGTPGDVAGAAVFLASDEASYITGQTLYVDGGWLAGGGNVKG